MKPDQSSDDKLLSSAIEQKLKLSYEQRIDSHEQARKLVEDLRREGENLIFGDSPLLDK